MGNLRLIEMMYSILRSIPPLRSDHFTALDTGDR